MKKNYICEIVDLSNAVLSDRAGSYGGMAGFKDGIIYNNDYWIIKYPKSTAEMNVEDASYTTSPLSEYIGSHIYEILGYDVHETLLGFRNNKIVVACRDFCKQEGSLREIRTVKNLANPFLADLLERNFSETGSSHCVNLEELIVHMKYNDILLHVPGIEERFWDCVVIDALINNNDRNNGNWGILKEDGKYVMAPIYDNGASFANKTSDTKLAGFLSSGERLKASALNTITGYGIEGKNFTIRKLFDLGYEELNKATLKLTPLIQGKFGEIEEMIYAIPEEYRGEYVCSDVRKKYYIESMRCRLENIFVPLCERLNGTKFVQAAEQIDEL